MLQLKETEAAWLAGLLEGEGCFGFYNVPRGKQLRLQLVTTDYDVAIYAIQLMSIIHAPRSRNDPRGFRKTTYHVSAYGENAARIMKIILPYMLGRRSEKIIEILNEYRKHKIAIGKEEAVI